MARNKYPEQTIERILDVSTKLFFEKGYENTSVKDILNELDGLSKGAIYHHFKSKEDIFDAVASRMGSGNLTTFAEVIQDSTLSGGDKLQNVVSLGISSTITKDIIEMSPNLIDNPKFLAIQIKEMRDVVAPKFFAPLIEEGIADGSIECDKPYELAEVIAILLNVWINPLILGSDKDRIAAKCKMINELLAQHRIILFNEELIKKLENL